MQVETSGDEGGRRAFGPVKMSGKALICWLGARRSRFLMMYFIMGRGSFRLA